MKNSFIIKSFRVKIVLSFILLMVFAGALGNFLIYEYSLRSEFDMLRENLMTMAGLVASMINGDDLLKIPLSAAGAASPQYKRVEEKLLKTREVAPDMAYIYILQKTGEGNNLKFIIDLKLSSGRTVRTPAIPGEKYAASQFPELMRGFEGPSADKSLTKDPWGIFLSGYAPIRNSKNETVAVLGIDMSAEDIYNLQAAVRLRTLIILVIELIVSFAAALLLSGPLTSSIKKLVSGVRHIASGDLEYRVRIKSRDEIRLLADEFNRMTVRLAAARKKIVEYFYRVMQSLVRALEAKDAYTKGHSGRVADYSVKIAGRLGFSPERIEVVKEAALLHDIGKIGIQDMVLNKKADFTGEDRDIIQKHTIIGEEILKPVSPKPEMLAAVRSHHERYDGTGYPDKKKGEEIDILAAIVAVADSFDAMTSHRPYVKNMTADEAIKELKKGSGSQFNPKVVEAFISVLKDGASRQ